MENKHILRTTVISISVILLIIIAFANFDHYSSLSKEKKLVNEVKETQSSLNTQFQELQKTRQEYLESLKQTLLDADEDNDGLSFEQELALGTTDYNNDTDLDGVPDNIDLHPAGGGVTHKETIEWIHNGNTITTQFGIPDDRYQWYKRQQRMDPTNPEYVTYTDLTIQTIAEDIADVSEILNEDQTYKVIIDFVQSMLYQYDIDYIGLDEYPKFPIETIVDKRGDCEDTSYLLAALYKALDVDAVLVLFPGHMATAVACDDCTGAYYDFKGENYFYVETTGSGWNLGQIPAMYQNYKATLVEI